MRMNYHKIIAMVVCFCFFFTFCGNGVLAAGNTQSLDGKYSVVRNDKDVCTVKTTDNGNELYASLDKATNEITVKVIEKTKKKLFGKDKETNYSVIIENYQNGEVNAVLIDKETKKEHRIHSKDHLEKVTAQIPVIFGGALLGALLQALLATAAVVLTFVTVQKIVDTITKNSNNKRVYFRAYCTYPGADVYMANFYDETSAKMLLELGYDLYTISPADAIYICQKVGGSYTGPTNDGNSRNAVHYHPLNYVGRGHVFFGNDPNLRFLNK